MRADRLLSIVMLLQARGRMTAQELAEELEVSLRTIYRDLEALNAAGVPVLADRGPGGGCMLPEQYQANLSALTGSEVRGLFLSAVPGPLADLGLGKAVEAAMLKLAAELPDTHKRDVERVRGRIHVDTAQWFRIEEPTPHLKTIEEALWQERTLLLTYRRADGNKVRRFVNPYGLVAKAGVWYLVAAMRGALFTYRVSRVREAELTHEHFKRPDTFDLRNYWERWCREFEENVSRYPVTMLVREEYLSQMPALYGEGVNALIEAAGAPDERGRIELTLTFESFNAALTHLLGMGTGAEIVSPAELRRAVLDMASRVVDMYTREGDETAHRRGAEGVEDDREKMRVLARQSRVRLD
jgi:predicted DNA-binding transcriptional regulator YafY